MDKYSREVFRMIDKMTRAGWISRSVSREDGGVIEWTDEGKAAMQLLHFLMFKSLKIKPGDESVFAWMVSDFPAGRQRVSKPRKAPPPG